MIKGIGIDIIEIDRIKEAVEKFGDSFLQKIYTAREINYCQNHKAVKFPELAGRFAAKEAYSKAIGTGIIGTGMEKEGVVGRAKGGISWKEIEIVNDLHGKPHIYLNGKLAKKVQVSLSHSLNSAVAMVYVEK